jgi:hypothetical protein
MTLHRISIITLMTIVLSAAPLWAGPPDVSGVEALKALVGEWEGTGPKGEPARVSYQLTSGGSTLVETFMFSDHPSMVTTYYVDGDHLMMTHYCSLKNQPRMRAALPAGQPKQLVFTFVDATNLSSPSQAHMHRVAFTFQDADHFTQEWTLSKDGKEQPEAFTLGRKK